MDGMGSRFGEKLTPQEAKEYQSLSFFEIIAIFVFIFVIISFFSSSKPKGGSFNLDPDNYESYEEYEEAVDNYNDLYEDYYRDYSPYDNARNW